MSQVRVRSVILLSAFIWGFEGIGIAATVGPTDRFVPLVQDGGGWSTRISITNLSESHALVVGVFMSERGLSEAWRIELKTTAGKARGGTVEIPLAPGATAVVESNGAGSTIRRGFADIVEVNDLPIGVHAVLTQKVEELPATSLGMALAPGHERRALMPLDLFDPSRVTELIWVSLTSSVQLDLTFRSLSGESVLKAKVDFDGRAQLTVKPRERWPELTGFRGTVQWVVSFPMADHYEARTLSGLQLSGTEGQAWAIVHPMTLPADQAPTSPYWRNIHQSFVEL